MIFRDDADRLMFITMLAGAVERFRWILHEFTLMGNHFHLVLETADVTFSRGMHWLNTKYAMYFNRRHDRRGHLFESRPHARLIDSDEYLLEVCRYTVLNPVRAGLVATAEEWRWSSYRAKAGLEPAPSWLTVEPTLSRLASDPEHARELYRHLVNDNPEIPCPWEKVSGQIFLGGPSFLAKMRGMIEEKKRSDENPRAQREVGRAPMATIIRSVARQFGTSGNAVRRGRGGEARMIAAHAGWHEGRLKLHEIGAPLGIRSRGHVSTLIRRCEQRATRDNGFAALIAACHERMRPHPPPVSILGTFPINRSE